MNRNERLLQGIRESIELKRAVLADAILLEKTGQAVALCLAAFRAGGKVLFCGNGGSAADAQHLAGELSGRFYRDRPPLFAEALHVNGAFLTAVANDYGYEEVFARMIDAAGRPGDVLFALSTSGNSPNVVRAAERARASSLQVVALTGESGGRLASHCDLLLPIPSRDTPRIQECHMLLGHLICEMIEAELFPA